MSPHAGFVAYLEALRPQVDAALDDLLPPAEAVPASLHGAMRYSVFAGGKRLRPALVVLVGETCGATRPDLLAAGAALELIHTYSLVHDDLPALDDDDLRRGRPTLHRAYDEATAILAGDALLTLGLRTLAVEPRAVDAERRRFAVEMVADAIGSGGMIGGQVEDLLAERGWPADPAAALVEIHRRKTGALLQAAVRLGGLYAGFAPTAAPAGTAGNENDELLSRLGASLGLLFQIGDDILDVVGEAAALGKSVGKDARAAKLTYPALYGLDDSRARLEAVRDEASRLAARLPGGGLLLRELIAFLAARDR